MIVRKWLARSFEEATVKLQSVHQVNMLFKRCFWYFWYLSAIYE